MNLKRKCQAEERAVAIIESLIEVTDKNDESEINQKLKEARDILNSNTGNDSVESKDVMNIIMFLEYIYNLFG